MSLLADVEALARALGVWRDGGGVPPAERRHLGEQWVIWPAAWTADHECKFWMRWWKPAVGELGGWTSAREHGPVDPPTAAIILLGHARGLRVDIGPCRVCGGAGEVETVVEHHGMRETLQCPECSEPCERCKGSGDVPGAPASWENPWGDAPDSCPDCLGYGILAKHGGRHLLAWGRAIIDALPKVSSVRRGGVDHGPFETPGDPATRTALTVLADQAQARGDKLGDVLAWWLDGECKSCGGTGGIPDYSLLTVDVLGARDRLPNMMRCDACLGARSVLGRHDAYLCEMVRWQAMLLESQPSSRHARA